MKFNQEFWESQANNYSNELISETIKLISFKTINDANTASDEYPFGKANADCLNYLLKKAEHDGFHTENYDNYAATIQYGTSEDVVGVVCHLDVVDADPTQWSTNPFVGVVKDGIIYGRGSNDDKGPTIASYLALKILADLKIPLSKSIHIILGCNEESGMVCMDHYLEKADKIPSTGFVSDCTFPVNFGEHGTAALMIKLPKPTYIDSFSSFLHKHIISGEAQAVVSMIDKDLIDSLNFYAKTHRVKVDVNEDTKLIRVIGKSAHGSRPQQSINATYHLLNFLSVYFKDDHFNQIIQSFDQTNGINLGIQNESYRYGNLSIAMTGALTDHDDLMLYMDCRYPSNLSADSLFKTMNSNLALIEPTIQIKVIEQTDGFFVDPNNELVKTLEAIYQDHYHDHSTYSKVSPGDTYARKFKGQLVGFGPTTNDHKKLKHVGQAHQPDEGMSIAALLKATAIYCEALYQLAK